MHSLYTIEVEFTLPWMLLSLSIYFEFFLSKSTDEIQTELSMPIFTNNYYSDGYIELKKKRLASKGCNDRFRIDGWIVRGVSRLRSHWWVPPPSIHPSTTSTQNAILVRRQKKNKKKKREELINFIWIRTKNKTSYHLSKTTSHIRYT